MTTATPGLGLKNGRAEGRKANGIWSTSPRSGRFVAAMDASASPKLERERHLLFLEMMALGLPKEYESQEINRLTLAYFAISGLSILDALDRVGTNLHPRSFFRDLGIVDLLALFFLWIPFWDLSISLEEEFWLWNRSISHISYNLVGAQLSDGNFQHSQWVFFSRSCYLLIWLELGRNYGALIYT